MCRNCCYNWDDCKNSFYEFNRSWTKKIPLAWGTVYKNSINSNPRQLSLANIEIEIEIEVKETIDFDIEWYFQTIDSSIKSQ